MALEVEGVVDGGVHAEKPLGGASRLVLGGQALANGSAEVANTKEAVPVTTTWNSSFDCPYVDQQWVNEYLDLTDGFYNGLFQFICRVVLSALRQGIELSAG